MRDTLAHGGPDDAGNFIHKNVALAHRRLSILDLSPLAHQPYIFENLILTYNGEVYNFLEIQKELKNFGYSFSSHSDTEVIIKAYHKWGKSCVDKFRGMFAFAIYDTNHDRLTLCRDRMGVKPLYYYFREGLFMFASELKAFLKHPRFEKRLNLKALSLYLQHGYIKAPFTIFENCQKLEPAHYLEIDKAQQIRLEKYWDILDYYENPIKSFDEQEAINNLENILTESFKLRMVSDVPVGVFLSGGVDSTIVTTLLQKESSTPLKTFTIGFNEKSVKDEAPTAKESAKFLKTDHTELYCTAKEALEIIPQIPHLLDEPMADSSIIPTTLVSHLAKSKVTVALSADGGDELFCGYPRFWMTKSRVNKFSNLPFKHSIGKILINNNDLIYQIYSKLSFLPRYPNLKDKIIKFGDMLNSSDVLEFYKISEQCFTPTDLKELNLDYLNQYDYLKLPKDLDFISTLMYLDTKSYLADDILTKVDRATMSVALEGREPLLDNKIVEFIARLPIEFKYKNKISKYPLKKILQKYIPNEYINRQKLGFVPPIFDWFKNDLKYLYSEYLSKEKIKKVGILNHHEVSKILNDYLKDKSVNHNKLWYLFVFMLWCESYI
ncbi:MAG: asparagine synthase (glutamine-hydrolyzing) [Epsilonproteobacteria bacterium]|nr:asparagine synthase (glutamine-hydrolyzing) [Campylobacterota bacterium]